MDDLSEKVAFITGAAGGIGLGIARAFSEVGVKIALTDIDTATLEASAEEMRANGAQVLAIGLDVTDRQAWVAAAERVHSELGSVQLLVNNAGVSTNGLMFHDVDPTLWSRVVDINLNGVYNGIHRFLPDLRSAGGGHIVNTSSMGGLAGFPGLSPYAATKFAVVGLSESLRAELAPAHIGVSVLCPGGVRSRLWRTSRAVRGLPDTDVPPSDMSGQSATATMEPYEVGRRVLDAVLANDLYVLTHPEFRPIAEQRHEQLMRGFDRAAAFTM